MNPLHHPIPPSSDTILAKFFERTIGVGSNRVYLRYKPMHGEPYADVSFAAFGTRVREVFAGFARLGIQRGDRIAVVSESRPEWLISEFAALALGAIWVPMFPTLTAQQIEFIVKDSEAKLLIVSNDLQLGKAVKLIGNCPFLEAIVLFNSETKLQSLPLKKILPKRHSERSKSEQSGDLRSEESLGLSARSFDSVHSSFVGMNSAQDDCILDQSSKINFLTFPFLSNLTGAIPDFDSEARKATSNDIVTIIYTSGTTGNPKGVMLSHGNVMANIVGALAAIPTLTDDDVALSFLPLCHAFEHVAMHFFFYRGMTVAFAESADTVADNLLEIRPTIMTGVPRFYERVHVRIMRMREKLPPAKRRLFDWALAIGAQNGLAFEGNAVPISARLLKPIADALVLKKIRERTGGRIRFFVSGAAALPAEVGRAFASFGLPIIEGYGLTEASPVLCVNPYQKLKWGTVGKPLHNLEIKIASDGEILARGPNIMQGYHKQPEATREMVDTDGWLHTGDIGAIDADGYLKITDRKKHIFVSTGGKNIAPAPIESLLGESRFIDQIMLIGDKRPFCTALIVPDFTALREAHIGMGDDTSSEALATNEAVRSAIGAELDRLQSGIASFERVRRFMVLPESFTIENGMMTPTLKIRRKAVEERYRELIDSMYQLRSVEQV